MLILGLDLESTGFDVEKERVTEIGLVLWDTDLKSPVQMYSEMIRWPDGHHGPLVQEVKDVTGLSDELLAKYGVPPNLAFAMANAFAMKAEYVVAHNGLDFDGPMIKHNYAHAAMGWQESPLSQKHWIDTRYDLPHEKAPDSNKLKHLALDVGGFINPFPHRALFDVLTMLKVLAKFDTEKVIELSKTPSVIVKANVSYDDRQLAKDQKYAWEAIGNMKFPKAWVKRMKKSQLEAETARCKFPIQVIKEF